MANSKPSKTNQPAPKKAQEKKPAPKKAQEKKPESKKTQEKKPAKNKKPNIFQRFAQYLKDVKMELKRVTWPTRPEVMRSSLVVIGALIFFGLLIFAIDSAVVPLLQLYSGLAV